MNTNLPVATPETARQPYTSPTTIADANGQDIMETVRCAHEAKWTAEKREEYHRQHPSRFAGPHKSFPIFDAEDVIHAETLHGHAANPAEIKANIIRIAKSLHLAHALPDSWEGTKDETSIKE